MSIRVISGYETKEIRLKLPKKWDNISQVKMCCINSIFQVFLTIWKLLANAVFCCIDVF